MNGKDCNTFFKSKDFDKDERCLVIIFEYFKMSLKDIMK